jgi:hypothetical protein
MSDLRASHGGSEGYRDVVPCSQVRDIDGDSWPDIAVVVSSVAQPLSRLIWYRNKAVEVILPQYEYAGVLMEVAAHNLAFTMEDLDGDGLVDLVVDEGKPYALRLYRGHGNGSFAMDSPQDLGHCAVSEGCFIMDMRCVVASLCCPL